METDKDGSKVEESGSEEKKEMKVLPPRQQGDTIISFLKKLTWRGFAVFFTYLLGYFNFSFAWVVTPVLLTVARDQYKKEKRQRLAAAREAALTNEQAMIESRMQVDDLPSWVYFPDKDRAEWVNNIIKQLWPNVNNYVRKMLFETVEPLVKNTLTEYKIKGFKFERENVHLGQVPPRITGVKVYNEKETNRNEIIMDLDIVFASDLEVVFSVKGIKAKVSEFSLRGMLRVVFKPLISEIPLIGGVQVYFLSDPEIDYSLGGVAGALDVPGLGKIVERIVSEQVRNFIVLPNKFTMPLVNNIPKKDLICPNTAGVLRVKLIRAKDMMQKDVAIIGKGKSDPYAILAVGATTYKTPTKTNTLDPEWNLTYDFPIEVVHGQEFMMEFFDEDDRKDDEFLGRATVQTGAVAERGEIKGFWVDLEECDSGKAQVSLSWIPITSDQSTVRELAQTEDDENAKCILHIYIDSVSGLDNPKNPTYKPCPLVQVTCAKETRQTWPKSYTNNPVIEQGFVLLVTSPHSDDIHLRILDTKQNNLCIGTVTVNVWKIIQEPGMEYPLQPWIVKGDSPDAKLSMAVSVRGLKINSLPTKSSTVPQSPLVEVSNSTKRTSIQMSSVSHDDTVKAGSLRLVIHKAVDLEDKDIGGKSDPYVIISYEDQQNNTQVCKNTINPEWNHEEVINIKENGDNHINLKVMDKDKFGKDECLGVTSLDVRRVSFLGEITQVWDALSQCKSGKILISAEFTPLKPSRPSDTEPAPFPVSPPASSPVIPTSPPTYSPSSPTPELPPVPPSDFSEPDPASAPVNLIEIEDDAHDEHQADDTTNQSLNLSGAVKDDFSFDHVDRRSPMKPEPSQVQADPEPELDVSGFVHVTVHRALDLEDKDSIGKSDPYVLIHFGDHIAKSKAHKNNLNPEFEFTESFVFTKGVSTRLRLEVFDKDVGEDEHLGWMEMDILDVFHGREFRNHWSDLQGAKSGKISFSVWFTESQPQDDDIVRRPSHNNIIAAALSPSVRLVNPDADLEGLAVGDGLRHREVCANGKIRLTLLYEESKEELKVFVHEALNLPGADLPDPPDPYVKVYLMPGKKKKKKTQVVKDSGNPRFDEEFDFDISFSKVRDCSLKVSVVDKKGVFAKSSLLGTVDISLDNPGLTQGIADWYPLHHTEDDSD